MIEWSIAAFGACDSVGSIVVACPPGHVDELEGQDRVEVVEGGATRAQSVSNALRAVSTELVAIHDAARPLITPQLIEDVVAILEGDPNAAGAIAATPVTDTIKQAAAPSDGAPDGCNALRPDGDRKTLHPVERTLDRGRLWAAQTPQVFRVAGLRKALAADPERIDVATDEAMIIESAGGKVLIHPSPPENLKVTAPLDLKLAELLLAERSAQ